MAASINASTSAGVVTTADTTGNLNLQSNGTTVLAMTSAGIAVTGTQSVSGAATLSSTLGVTGATTLSSTLSAAGNISATGTAIITSASSVESSGPIQAHGANKATISYEASVSGPVFTGYGPNTSTLGRMWFRQAYSNGGPVNSATINTNGCFGVGLDSPTYQITAASNANGLAYIYQASTGTGVYLPLGNNAWSAASDERLKDIIEPITDASTKLSTLRTVIGKFKTDADGTRRPFLIAQDVQKIMPEVIDHAPNEHESGEQMLGLQYANMIPLLVAAINELTHRLAALEGK